MKSSPVEIHSVSEWNSALRTCKAEGRTVAVDFHATWCGPCKQIAPIYSNLASQYPQVMFLRVDVDKVQPIAAKYRISAMPTFLAIKAGNVVDTMKGADPQGLTQMIIRHAGPNPPAVPLSEAAEEAKSKGNEAFKQRHWSTAVEHYSKGIEEAPNSAALYANRSVSILKHLASPSASTPLASAPEPLEQALADARKATELLPTWGKGWVRLGEALVASVAAGGSEEQKQEAVRAFELAVEWSEGTVKEEAKEKLAKVKA